ncbi:MAG TPA: TolC family protein [Acidobacteriaceae bacterium]|jgi:outer membrane protein TolC|nr:TolC family protein [Acidobacteriaceae bacterium]
MRAGDGWTARILSTALLFLVLPAVTWAQISLSTAVDLAEKNSVAVRSAQASVRRAMGGVSEARDAYIPNFVFGANPGYVYGYPLGYPSLFEASSQSILFSFSQPDYIRSAQAGLKSATLSLKDTEQQVALDVALDYVQLNHDLAEVAALDEEKGYADSLVQIEGNRVGAGVDPHMSQLQAELTAAQIDAKRVHLENDADDMRQKIGDLTGLPAQGLTTRNSSVPPVDNAIFGSGSDEQPVEENPGVAAAYANAKSKLYTSWGDDRQNLRPLITFGGQYSLFEKFANYTQYFPNGLQYNNAAIGVVVTLPFFDASRRAKARESAADAEKAEADAESSKNILSEQTGAMRRALRELAAQQKVNELQSEVAQEQLKTVETQFTNGTGSPGAAPVTPKEEQQAHIDERERYEDVLDANFSLLKVQLNLLRETGQLETWLRTAENGPPAAPTPAVNHSIQVP